MTKQLELRLPPSTEQVHEEEQEAGGGHNDAVRLKVERESKIDRAFRMNTKTDWDEQDMALLKEEMKKDMLRQKQQVIAGMMDRSDSLRGHDNSQQQQPQGQ